MSKSHLQLFEQSLLNDVSTMVSHVNRVIYDSNSNIYTCHYDEIKNFAIKRLAERYNKRFFTQDRNLDQLAVANFIKSNEDCGNIDLTLSSDYVNDARLFILRALESFTRSHSSTSESSIRETTVQECFSLPLLMSFWKFGPGASNGVSGTHFSEKIQQDMTCTHRAFPLVRLIRKITPNLYRYDCDKQRFGVTLIKGSRLTTVPKNQETARTIAIEPSGNMAMQLAAGIYLEGALRSVGIDIKNQAEKNKNLARLGSIDGSLCTIDLKNASDMISIALVKELMPPVWYDLLMDIRSEEIGLPNGESVRMNMISTMGNGFTFPLMTLILSALTYAALLHNGFLPVSKRSEVSHIDYNRFGIFGDDIIVDNNAFHCVCSTLRAAGLLVNTQKSCYSGFFRESCGGDYYKGVLVTPFYVESLDSDAEVYIAINKVIAWCCMFSLRATTALQTLVKMLHKGKPLLVPEWSQPYEGILTMEVSRNYKALARCNRPRTFKGSEKILMLCALGGYVTSGYDGNVVYQRRENFEKYSVVKRHLPKGWVDGRDPSLRGHDEARFASWVVSLVA